MEKLSNGVLPCMQKYYIGKSNYQKSKCLENHKCEYLNGMYDFINKCYPEYVVTECCDIDNRKPFPEAILTNLKNSKTIAIEMKSFPDKVYSNVKETNDKNKKEVTFWNKIIDRCALEAQKTLVAFFKDIGIADNSEHLGQLLEIVFYGMNVKLISKVRTSVQEIIMKEKYDSKQKNFVIESMVSYSKKMLTDLINKNELSMMQTFENDELKVIIYLGKNESIYFEIHDNNVTTLSDFVKMDQNGISDFLRQFIEGCVKKFANVEVDKRILLLDNTFIAYKRDNQIKECLQNLSVNPSIDEIWLTEKEYDDEYDEDGNPKETYISKIKYERIYCQTTL